MPEDSKFKHGSLSGLPCTLQPRTKNPCKNH